MNEQQGVAERGRLTAMVTILLLTGVSSVRAAMLRGTVLGREGQPAVGAIVWAAELFAPGPLAARETRTDTEGQFTLELKPGHWLVWARRGDFVGEVDREKEPEVRAGIDPAPVTIRMRDRGHLVGRLLEAETGKPIPGGRFATDTAVVLTADEHGRFELAGLSTREHEAYVIAPGRERRRILFDTTLRPRAELELRIPLAASIIGRVTDEQGRPIPGAVVGHHTSGRAFSGNALWERCDPDGRFVWEGKEFDRPTRIAAEAPGYQSDEKSGLIIARGAGPLEVNFRLKPDPTLARAQAAQPVEPAEARRDVTGTVTLPEGKPAANAIVRWGTNQHSASQQARADAEGRFRLARVPDEPGVLAVIPAGTTAAPAFPHVERGGDRDVRVALEQGGSVRGRVHDDTGAAVEGVSVIPVIPSQDERLGNQLWLGELTATTDAEGRFTLQGLPRFGALFDFLGRSYSDLRNQSLTLGGADNDIELVGGGAIRGRVVDPDGHPVRNYRILINFPHERHPGDRSGGYFAGYCGIGLTFTSADGVFVVTGIGAGGVYRVSALAEGHGEGVIDRAVSTTLGRLPPPDELTVRLSPPHVLRVQAVATGDDARPIPSARVTLVNGDPGLDKQFMWGYHDASWEDMVRARTDAHGWAEFNRLTFGEATILVQAPGYGRSRLGWRDGRRELVVKLQPEAVVNGDIRDEAGKPARNVYVNLLGKGGDQISQSVEPDDRGHFRLSELPEGQYGLSVVSHSGAQLYQEEVGLRPGQTLDRTIDVPKDAEEQAMRKALPPPVLKESKLVKVGAVAPAFAIETLEGAALKLEDYRGKYVLLDFWATWCGPCLEEVPHIKAVYDQFDKDDRFVVISLSLDATRDDPKTYLKDHSLPWVHGFLGDWRKDPVSGSYGVQSIPSVFLISPDGKIIANELRGDSIKAAVAKALDHPQ
jgi:thiol-disulfide isomerase/thioredoxin/protocatechuate 3,4-dioxygenase beta subunit